MSSSYAREKTLDLALERALRGRSGSARVVRSANIPLALPASGALVEDDVGLAARIAVVDGGSFAATLAPLVEGAPADVRVVVVAPITHGGGRGLLGKLSATVRRLAPVDLVDASEGLRHAGIIGVRVVLVDGALGLAVLSGDTTPS